METRWIIDEEEVQGKVMATVFWDMTGVILIEYLERGHTINADRYCATLTKLREAILRKRPGLPSKGVILRHDDARSHTIRQTQELLQMLKWEVWNHPPDLSPSDYFIFPALKRNLPGSLFNSDDAVKAAAVK